MPNVARNEQIITGELTREHRVYCDLTSTSYRMGYMSGLMVTPDRSWARRAVEIHENQCGKCDTTEVKAWADQVYENFDDVVAKEARRQGVDMEPPA